MLRFWIAQSVEHIPTLGDFTPFQEISMKWDAIDEIIRLNTRWLRLFCFMILARHRATMPRHVGSAAHSERLGVLESKRLGQQELSGGRRWAALIMKENKVSLRLNTRRTPVTK